MNAAPRAETASMQPGETLILAIEASNPGSDAGGGEPIPGGRPRAGVALGRSRETGLEVLGVEPMLPASRRHDDLMPAIDRLSRRVGVRPGDIGTLAVSIGPGGFTSLRIAVATAKMLADATGARCVAVPTAIGVIRRVDPAFRCGRETVVLLAWKRHDAWRERFPPDASTRPLPGGGLVPLHHIAEERGTLLVCDRPLEQSLRMRGLFPSDGHWIEPQFDPVAILEASHDLPAIDPVSLMPIYPRLPEAVSLHHARAGRR